VLVGGRNGRLWLQGEREVTSDQAAVVMGIGAHCGIAQVSNPLHTTKMLDLTLAAPK
jgi:hypothetical protein